MSFLKFEKRETSLSFFYSIVISYSIELECDFLFYRIRIQFSYSSSVEKVCLWEHVDFVLTYSIELELIEYVFDLRNEKASNPHKKDIHRRMKRIARLIQKWVGKPPNSLNLNETFFILHTIPIVASTVCIKKPTYFRKRERERKIRKKGGSKKYRPRNSSRRINVGIGT
jgi:hypothetical protein